MRLLRCYSRFLPRHSRESGNPEGWVTPSARPVPQISDLDSRERAMSTRPRQARRRIAGGSHRSLLSHLSRKSPLCAFLVWRVLWYSGCGWLAVGLLPRGLVAIKTECFRPRVNLFLYERKSRRGDFQREVSDEGRSRSASALAEHGLPRFSIRILKGAGGKRLTGEGERDAGIIQMQPSPPREAKRESRATNPFSREAYRGRFRNSYFWRRWQRLGDVGLANGASHTKSGTNSSQRIPSPFMGEG